MDTLAAALAYASQGVPLFPWRLRDAAADLKKARRTWAGRRHDRSRSDQAVVSRSSDSWESVVSFSGFRSRPDDFNLNSSTGPSQSARCQPTRLTNQILAASPRHVVRPV